MSYLKYFFLAIMVALGCKNPDKQIISNYRWNVTETRLGDSIISFEPNSLFINLPALDVYDYGQISLPVNLRWIRPEEAVFGKYRFVKLDTTSFIEIYASDYRYKYFDGLYEYKLWQDDEKVNLEMHSDTIYIEAYRWLNQQKMFP